MKTTRSLMFLMVVLALATAAGCAATPEDRWFQQREALNTANRVYLAQRHQLTDEQIILHGELLQAARASLDEAKAQLPEGGPTFDATLDVVESILIRLAAPDIQTPVTEDTPHDTR